MSEKLDAIRKEFKDRSQHLAPIFVPTTRPGPTLDIQGNYFLEEDPWSKGLLLDDSSEEKIEREGEGKQHDEQTSGLCLNIFLVVEPQQLSTVQTTINGLQHSTVSDMNLIYVVFTSEWQRNWRNKRNHQNLSRVHQFFFHRLLSQETYGWG